MIRVISAESCRRSVLSCMWFGTQNPSGPLACKWRLVSLPRERQLPHVRQSMATTRSRSERHPL